MYCFKDMIRNRRLSINDILKKPFKSRKGGRRNDEIYDRWHGRINETLVEDEEEPTVLPKQTDMGYYYWIGKDYANAYVEDFKDIHEHAKDQFDREQVPRMPWRDQAVCVLGLAARDLARHFIQRWNQCKVNDF
jgi:hypothetical protein